MVAEALHAEYGDMEAAELETRNVRAKVAGRLMSRRVMGKASFAHLQDMSGRIQLSVQRDQLGADEDAWFKTELEIANGFSELNDPEDQAEPFRRQVADKDAGDLEAMHFDADFIRALEDGMPPTAAEGIGIDCLVMLFTDSPPIPDVLLFPHVRPAENG